jgi:hypothetical protein
MRSLQKKSIFVVALASSLLFGAACQPQLAEIATDAEEGVQAFLQGIAATMAPEIGSASELWSEMIYTPEPTPVRDTDLPYNASDRADDVEGFQIHFLYILPSDGVDDFLDVNGKIALSAAAMNSWLEGQTQHRLRFDTYEGELDVSFMRLPYTADEIDNLGTSVLSLVEYEIKTSGFNASQKLFVVYYDGFFVSKEGYCGLASYPPDGAGVTAVLLLRGYNPEYDLVCPRQFTQSEDYTGYFEMTILHELLHLMGAVPACAPSYTDGHVNDSTQDLMYYQYDGSYSPLYTQLDFGNDDYYGHGNPQCVDLARSIFLEPLPENAQTPPGWLISSTYIPANPLLEK